MDDTLPPSPYQTLNVPKDATLATIRKAHRKLVLSCHPDRVCNESDESEKKQKAEQFHQIQQAYEILGDEDRRQRYDGKVKLTELKTEMAEERGSLWPRTSYDSTKYDTRGHKDSDSGWYFSSRSNSNDSGYATRLPSVASRQSSKSSSGNQQSSDIEVVRVPPAFHSEHKKEHRNR